MGGNVLVKGDEGDVRADHIDLTRGIKRSDLVRDFVELFSIIDSIYSSEYGETLWPPGQVKRLASSGKMFTGSSEHLFDPKIGDDEFVAHKPIVGDISPFNTWGRKRQVRAELATVQLKFMQFLGIHLSQEPLLFGFKSILCPPLTTEVNLQSLHVLQSLLRGVTLRLAV